MERWTVLSASLTRKGRCADNVQTTDLHSFEMEWIDLCNIKLRGKPGIAAVTCGLQESPTAGISVLALASSTITLYFFHCAFALSVTSHYFKRRKINLPIVRSKKEFYSWKISDLKNVNLTYSTWYMFSILIWSWVRGNKIVGEKIKDIDLISLGYSRWQSNALGLCPCSGSFTNQEAVQHGIIFARVSLK